MPKKTFLNGYPLPASDLNTYLMDQSVMTFASATARTSAIPAPTEGMTTYLEDVNQVQVYNGSAWEVLAIESSVLLKQPITDQVITASSATVTPLAVKGAVSQTDKLFEAQNSAGTAVASIANDGQMFAGGGAFPIPFRMSGGEIYGGAGATTVTYPASRFTLNPKIIAQCADNQRFTISATSSTSFTFQTTVGANITLFWFAFQFTSSSSAG